MGILRREFQRNDSTDLLLYVDSQSVFHISNSFSYASLLLMGTFSSLKVILDLVVVLVKS